MGLLEHGSKRNCRRKVTEKHERRQCADGGTMCTLALIGRYGAAHSLSSTSFGSFGDSDCLGWEWELRSML